MASGLRRRTQPAGSTKRRVDLPLSTDAQLAYVVSAYKNLDQVARLARRLATDGSTVLIHVDKKTDGREYDRLVRSVADISAIHFLERHTCHWGGFGHVRATLKGIHELLSLGTPFAQLILLTGQDYPIKPFEEIRGFFATNPGRTFMAYSRLPSPWWSPDGGLDRIRFRHLRWRGRHVRLPVERRFPQGLEPFGGGAYWCMSRECVEHVAAFVAERSDVVRFFHHVDIPDEIFFQTAVLNSHLAGTVVNDNLRYIDWTRGPRPAVLGVDDLEKLQQSDKLFARKLDVTHDPRVLELIDREILGMRP